MSRGYTLIELLIVIAILGILTGLASLSIVSFSKSSDEEATCVIAKAALKEARSNSLAVLNDHPWGVHFETNRAIVYQDSGSGYNPSDPENVVKVLAANTGLSWSISGGDDILFVKRTGKTTNTGTINCQGSNPAEKSVTVNAEGMVE